MIRALFRPRNEHAARSAAPTAAADFYGAVAGAAGLAEHGQFGDAVNHWEKRDGADRAKRPSRRFDSKLHRGHAGFDAFPDREIVVCRAKLDRGTLHDAKHPPFGFRPSFRTVEANAMNGGDDIVVDRSKRRDHARDEIGVARVFIAPWCARVKAQHLAREMIRQQQRARLEIILNESPARVACLAPQALCAFDADKVVLSAVSRLLDFKVDRVEVPFVNVLGLDGSLLFAVVAWRPCGQAEL